VGYKYFDLVGATGPIRSVAVRDGGRSGAGGALPKAAIPLDQDPGPVGVVLTLGSTRYCMSFGGATSFIPMRRFSAKNALAPAACPP
jgi:hypothetical protein